MIDLQTLAEWFNSQTRRPTARQTAEKFGVSVTTAHKAIREANAAGLIVARTMEDRWAK